MEHDVARAVAVLRAEQLRRDAEQAPLIGRDEEQLFRAAHEQVDIGMRLYGHRGER